MRVAISPAAGAAHVVEDLPLPPVGPLDVVVDVAASGVCHTDLTVLNMPGREQPVIGGHEACGTVVEVGRDVRRVRVGDRVLSSVAPACGTCWWCRNEMSNHCERGNAVMAAERFTTSAGPATAVCGVGSFAETMVVDESSVVRVETDLPDEQLALIGCGVSTGLGAALHTAEVRPGSSVAVIGCGGVGLSVIQGARIAGATRIIAIDLAANRRASALASGATEVVDPADGDVLEQVRSLTHGRGVDHAFEVVGVPALMKQAFDLARDEGSVTLVGMPARFDATVEFNAMSLIFSGKRVQGSVMGGTQILRDFDRYVQLAESGRLDLGSMVSRRIGLDDVDDGLARLRDADGVRSVIVPA